MKVSVVISTYKRPKRLLKAIESVRAQTFKDWELIVVHDGPWNKLGFPVADNIHYKHIPHFGTDTRPKNFGIKLSKGDYIAFLDDDNTWRPDHLQALVNELDRDNEIDLVYCDRWVIYEDKSETDRRGLAEDFHFGTLGAHNYIDTSDVLVRREALFAVGGFDERYRKYVDWNLWWRMEKYGFIFKRVPLMLTDYHIHSEGMKSLRKEDARGQGIPAWDPVDLEVELPFLGKKTEPRVAIFSLVYDRPEYTIKCFDSLYKTAGYNFDHFVVAQTPKDARLIRKHYPTAIVIENKENVGISRGSNQALDEISKQNYDIIGKVDPDCLFISKDWLKTMVRIWKSNHKLAMSTYIQGLRDNPGGAPREFYGYLFADKVQVGFSRHIGGICVFTTARAYKDFRWDENAFLHGEQDLEFSQYIRTRGYACCYLENLFAEHYEGTAGQHERYPEYFERRKLEKSTRYVKNR